MLICHGDRRRGLVLMFLWFRAALVFHWRFQFIALCADSAGRRCRRAVRLAGDGQETGEQSSGGRPGGSDDARGNGVL